MARTIMDIVMNRLGTSGKELDDALIGKDNKTLYFDTEVYGELIDGLKTERMYTHEEVLRLGMMFSEEVRDYVIKCEKEYISHLEEKKLNRMGLTKHPYKHGWI